MSQAGSNNGGGSGPGSHDLHAARFIVSAGGNVDGANFTTIASAYAAAVTAGGNQTVFIQPGTYTENITLTPGVNLTAFGSDSSLNQTGAVVIVGKLTLTTAGSVTISGIQLQTNSDFLVAVTGSAASIVNLNNCNLNCTNHTGISYTSSSGSSAVNISYCTGDLGTTGIAVFTATGAGTMTIVYTHFTNTGLSTTSSTTSACLITIQYSNFNSPFTSSGTGSWDFYQCALNTISTNTTVLTTGGNGGTIRRSLIFTGSASAVSVGDSFSVLSCDISSSNTNVITGSGTVTTADLVFDPLSKANINTSNQTVVPYLSLIPRTATSASTYTVLSMDYFISVDASGGAKQVNLPNAPSTNQVFIIKDRTGSAATHNITVTTPGGTVDIDGATTYTIANNFGSIEVVFNGSAYEVF